MKILHVTDCFNGGVQEVIQEIMVTAIDCEHFLLFDVHDNDPHDYSAVLRNMNNHASIWERGAWRRIKHLRCVVNDNSIDLVHLHSSRAGFYGRVSLPRKLIVYSSHGFGFERRDISLFFRILIFVVEFLLTCKTNIYLANWPNEYKIAKRMHRRDRVKYAPIIISKFMSKPKLKRKYDHKSFQIATIGRITNAKDPIFFQKVSEKIKSNQTIEWLWLGDGSSAFRNDLEAAGIEISGWLPEIELSERLQKIRIILITSLWDAGPITLYLAVSQGIPVMVRDFPAGKILGFQHGRNLNEFCKSLQILIDSQQFESFALEQHNRISRIMVENYSKEIGDIYLELGQGK
jgi:hypothetical protein